MNLKILNRIELDLRIKSLATKERELLHEVLLTIKEIDGRRMYLEMGFSSLYSYLTEEVGYSDGYAQRRIDAARLLKDLPMLGEKIQAGTVNLSQTTLMQKAFRDAKNQCQVVSAKDKAMLLEHIGNKSYRETQKEIAVFLDLPIQMAEIKTMQADDSMRVTLYMSKELCEKLNRAQELLSHSLPNKELTAYLEYTADKVIEQKTAVRAKSPKSKGMKVGSIYKTELNVKYTSS